jgi:hypothetical protein
MKYILIILALSILLSSCEGIEKIIKTHKLEASRKKPIPPHKDPMHKNNYQDLVDEHIVIKPKKNK